MSSAFESLQNRPSTLVVMTLLSPERKDVAGERFCAVVRLEYKQMFRPMQSSFMLWSNCQERGGDDETTFETRPALGRTAS